MLDGPLWHVFEEGSFTCGTLNSVREGPVTIAGRQSGAVSGRSLVLAVRLRLLALTALSEATDTFLLTTRGGDDGGSVTGWRGVVSGSRLVRRPLDLSPTADSPWGEA